MGIRVSVGEALWFHDTRHGTELAPAIAMVMRPSMHGAWTRAAVAAGCLVIGVTLSGCGGDASSEPGEPLRLDGIWIGRAEIEQLPTEGAAWEQLLDAARQPTDKPDLSKQNDPTNVRVMAKALAYARTGDENLRYEIIDALIRIQGTERGARTLAVGRNVMAYVVAADLVRLPPELDGDFRAWLRELLGKKLGGKTLRSTHERRPNNWGTHAGASRAAIAAYLGDRAELEQTARVFRGWLGDREAYAGFEYGESWWQANPSRPVGINPAGATRDGKSIDGVLPDDQRRAGGFAWPPPKENYVYGALQGALAQAVILHRAGYDVWNWQDQALLRAFRWLHEHAAYPPEGDDEWQSPLIDFFYGTHYWDGTPTRPGKNAGWTDWTHATTRS